MLKSHVSHRRSRQFTLRSLFAFITLATLPLAVAHYWLDGPEFFRWIVTGAAGMLAVVVVLDLTVAVPMVVIVGLVWMWSERGERPALGVFALIVVALWLIFLLLPVIKMACG